MGVVVRRIVGGRGEGPWVVILVGFWFVEGV